MVTLFPWHRYVDGHVDPRRVHDFRRFASAPALMAYLGLVPGELERRKASTWPHHADWERAGPPLLVETAWHYQHRPSVGVALMRRRKGQPGRVIAIADKAQQRLCRRFRKLAAEHKPAPKVAVAIARELAGFLGPRWNGCRNRRRSDAGTGGDGVIIRLVTDREDGGGSEARFRGSAEKQCDMDSRPHSQ